MTAARYNILLKRSGNMLLKKQGIQREIIYFMHSVHGMLNIASDFKSLDKLQPV